MDERTDEELELVFELGCIKSFFGTRTPSSIQLQNDHFKQKYFDFKTKAGKIGIDLPDQPPENTKAEDKMDQFFSNQIDHVVKYLKQHKKRYIQEIFSIGDCVEQLLNALGECIEAFGEDKSLWDKNVKRLPAIVEELQIRAKSLGIDISEDLSTVNVHQPQLDYDGLRILELKLKVKVCKHVNEPTPNTKRSEVDPTRIFTDNVWAVSMVRLPNTKTSKHVFLVLEGTEADKSIIWFVDFVANDIFNLVSPGMRDGKVRMDYHELEDDGASEKMLFRCDREMMTVRSGDRLLYSTWSIPKATAKSLIKNIQEQQKDPPKFNILGDSKLAASSAFSSSNPTCHNCFTFARMMLRNLNDEYIQIPQDKFDKWIASVPGRTLLHK